MLLVPPVVKFGMRRNVSDIDFSYDTAWRWILDDFSQYLIRSFMHPKKHALAVVSV